MNGDSSLVSKPEIDIKGEKLKAEEEKVGLLSSKLTLINESIEYSVFTQSNDSINSNLRKSVVVRSALTAALAKEGIKNNHALNPAINGRSLSLDSSQFDLIFLKEEEKGKNCIPRSSSLPTHSLVSSLRGSKPRPKELHVNWAADVYDPPPSISSHTLGPYRSYKISHRTKRKDSKKGKRKDSHKHSPSHHSSPNSHLKSHSYNATTSSWKKGGGGAGGRGEKEKNSLISCNKEDEKKDSTSAKGNTKQEGESMGESEDKEDDFFIHEMEKESEEDARDDGYNNIINSNNEKEEDKDEDGENGGWNIVCRKKHSIKSIPNPPCSVSIDSIDRLHGLGSGEEKMASSWSKVMSSSTESDSVDFDFDLTESDSLDSLDWPLGLKLEDFSHLKLSKKNEKSNSYFAVQKQNENIQFNKIIIDNDR